MSSVTMDCSASADHPFRGSEQTSATSKEPVDPILQFDSLGILIYLRYLL